MGAVVASDDVIPAWLAGEVLRERRASDAAGLGCLGGHQRKHVLPVAGWDADAVGEATSDVRDVDADRGCGAAVFGDDRVQPYREWGFADAPFRVGDGHDREPREGAIDGRDGGALAHFGGLGVRGDPEVEDGVESGL